MQIPIWVVLILSLDEFKLNRIIKKILNFELNPK